MPVSSTRLDSPSALDIDRLDAYRVALAFAAFAATLRIRSAALADQLERAASSIPLNLAEAVGRISAADQAHFFAIARGSALECAAILDVLHARDLLGSDAHRSGRGLLARLVAMLTGLLRRRVAKRGP
jgi:four helix bundle protein